MSKHNPKFVTGNLGDMPTSPIAAVKDAVMRAFEMSTKSFSMSTLEASNTARQLSVAFDIAAGAMIDDD